MNSFRAVEQAIEYEAQRQFDVWKETGKKLGEVSKETRGWDADAGRHLRPARQGRSLATIATSPIPTWCPSRSRRQLARTNPRSLERIPRRQTPAASRPTHHLSHYDASVIVAQGRTFADYFERVRRPAATPSRRPTGSHRTCCAK